MYAKIEDDEEVVMLDRQASEGCILRVRICHKQDRNRTKWDKPTNKQTSAKEGSTQREQEQVVALARVTKTDLCKTTGL